jgi:hypothetical protein
MMLVAIHSVGVVSTLEALDIPEATLKKCADETGKTVICISNKAAVGSEEREAYNAMKAKASNVFFRLHLFTKAGERSAQLPYS